MVQWVKNPPAMQEMKETWVRHLGWEDPLEEDMATHSSTLAWRITWTEESGGLQSWGCKESDTTEATEHACMHARWCVGPSLCPKRRRSRSESLVLCREPCEVVGKLSRSDRSCMGRLQTAWYLSSILKY